MDAGQRRTVEAEVILHAVNPELSTTAEGEGKLCPGLLKNNGNTNNGNAPCMGGFLQHDDDDDDEFSLPKTFEKEYLLDGSLTVNHNFDHQKGNGLYISKTTRISNDISVHTDSAVNTLNAATAQNGTRGKKNGISENSNQAKEEVDGGGLSVRADRSVSGQFVTGNVTSSFAAPDTHCVPAGPRPTDEELAPSFPHSAQAAEPSQCDPLCPGSGLKRCVGNGDSGQTAERAPSLKEPDLIIEVSGQRISAHKSVLAEKSDYFKARLSRDILKVKGVNFKTMSILVDYVYTSQMNVRKDNVVDVITGAKVLQIPCAVQAAMDSMSQQITTDNCYEILTIAKKQRLNELKETAYRFMSDNFLQILKDPSVYGRLTGSERDLVLKKRMEGKRTLMVAEINDVFDRVGSRPASRCNSRPQSPLSVVSFEDNHMIYFFSEAANDWRPLTMMPEDINTKGCGICTMYNYLFVAGGIKGYGEKGKVSDKVFCYNPITNNWTEVRPLTQARSQLKLVSMDGCLYAIGGECLFTVEKYDPRMDRWTTVAALPKGAFAVAHEATTCNGELYVSGGSLFYRLLRYDTKRDEWQECPYNNSRKKSTDMVAFKNFIYRFDVNREQGINVFKYNTIVKMWHDVASQRLGSHLPFRCAVIGNCIYCVNKTQTLQFIVQEENASYFVEEPLPAPLEAKGVLFPFVLSLPEKSDKVI